jgi:hypothetical protein
MLDELKKDAQERMGKCVLNFQTDMKKLRTGRAHPSLIEHLKVDYYGSDVPLSQVASINVEEGRTLVIAPWEKTVVQASGSIRSRPAPSFAFPCRRSPKSAAARSRRWLSMMRKMRAWPSATSAAMS